MPITNGICSKGDFVQKANPYHDEQGRFTSKDKDADGKISEGSAVQITGNVRGRGRYGIVSQVSSDGNFVGVKNKFGEYLGSFHASDITSSAGPGDSKVRQTRGTSDRTEVAPSGVKPTHREVAASLSRFKPGSGTAENRLAEMYANRDIYKTPKQRAAFAREAEYWLSKVKKTEDVPKKMDALTSRSDLARKCSEQKKVQKEQPSYGEVLKKKRPAIGQATFQTMPMNTDAISSALTAANS